MNKIETEFRRLRTELQEMKPNARRIKKDAERDIETIRAAQEKRVRKNAKRALIMSGAYERKKA